MADKAGSGSTRIIKNVLMNWVAYATTIITGFFMQPFLVHHLGDSLYGVWVLIGSLAGYLGLLDFGLTPATVKYVAEYRARGDQTAINRLVSGGMLVFSALGCLVLVATFVLAFCFNSIFHTQLSNSTAAIIVFIAGLDLAITFPASVYVGVLRGYQRYDADAAVTAFTILARSALLVVFIGRGYGIWALALLTLIFDIVRLGYITYCVYGINPDIRIARAHLDWSEMRRLLGFSSFFFLIMVGNQINFLTDSIVIGSMLPVAVAMTSVTIYNIANRLVSYLRDLVVEMSGVLMPAFSGLYAGNDHAKMQELHILNTKYTLLISLPLASVFFVLGDVFISVWMGPRYAESARLLNILTIAIIAHLAVNPTNGVLIGMGKHQIVAKFSIAQALTNLVVSILLVKTYGLIGVALGTAVSMIVFALISLPVYFHYHLKLSLGTYLRRAMLLPVVIQPLFAALLFAVARYARPFSIWSFFGEVALSFMPYGLLVYGVCMSPPEKQAFARLVSKAQRSPAA